MHALIGDNVIFRSDSCRNCRECKRYVNSAAYRNQRRDGAA